MMDDDDTGRSHPIERPGFLHGVDVVDIGDYRVARGSTRRVFTSCPHKHLHYDEKERRIWCVDCERDVDPFDAFTRLVTAFDGATKALERRERHLAEAEGFQSRSLAGRSLDKAWRKRKLVPACPHCKHWLHPDDFRDGVPMLGREYAEAQRNRNKNA